jgi:hypothetical protein
MNVTCITPEKCRCIAFEHMMYPYPLLFPFTALALAPCAPCEPVPRFA